MGKKTSVFDDGFQEYLTRDAIFVGEPGIPMLMDLRNVQIPRSMIPYEMAHSCKNHRQYVHFYMQDRKFSSVLTATSRYLNILKQFDGVITPDCSLLINQSKCLQQANTYMNRAVGFFLQKNGIPVIPNIRWSDESSFSYCFLGVPSKSIVCVSTHGCIDDKVLRSMFISGLEAMLDVLCPTSVLVHGRMPEDIFGKFIDRTQFYRYPSQFELTHGKVGA